MNSTCLISIILFFVCCNQPITVDNKKKELDLLMEELVLKNEQKGIEFYTKVKISDGILEYKTIYIGQISNMKNEKIDFIYTTIYSGNYEDSKRAHPRIILYKNFMRLGHYYIGSDDYKIPNIVNKELILNRDEDGGCNKVTRINFFDSIPKTIFIECSESNNQTWGDIYFFENNYSEN